MNARSRMGRSVLCELGYATGSNVTKAHELSAGQRAYEERRAAKAGMSLEKWLAAKEREQAEAVKVKTRSTPKPPKPPGMLSRLIERAHRPLKG